MRDIVLEETVYFDFTTRAFATGIPTTLAGSPTLSVLEENNATPITDGVSISVDRASVAGLNEATVVATSANGYENGKGYSVYISTGTVGGVSVVGEKIAEFTIGASAAAQDLANGTDGLGAIKSDTASTLVDTAEIGTAGAGLTSINLPNQTMDITGNITGNLSGSVGSVTGAVGSVTGNVDGNVTGSVGSVTVGVTVTTNNDKTGYSISGTITTLDGLNNFDPSANIVSLVANVTTVTNCTNNSDMVAEPTTLLTTQMTESYAANGVAPTFAQAQFAIHQMLMEFAIAGTSLTVKQLDSLTTAFIVTLDDATNPTSASR